MASIVFSVGLELPGGVAETVPFRSSRSVFDADVVVFAPSISTYHSYESYAGHRLISEGESASLTKDLAHWKAELGAALSSGKTVFIVLSKPEDAYYHTGSQSHSGTGRSRVTTRHVAPISSYACLPVQLHGLAPRSGTEMSVMADLGALAGYWSEFAARTAYEAYFDPKGVQPLLGTKKREKVVGAIITHASGGALILLPPVKWDVEALTYTRGDSTYWRKDAVALGSRLVSAYVGVSDARRKSAKRTPPPDWALQPRWALAEEQRVQADIAKTDAAIVKLTEKRTELSEELDRARELYGLLYETGPALEHAIRLGLRHLGFKAERYKEGESEFDVVFVAPEGRFLGEAEGKDAKAVNIDKMSQLERNLQEDFARDEVTEFAKGVLFGNAHRFTAPEGRADSFTPKCASAAKRLHVALVRTPDLFTVARYLAEAADDAFAARCRQAIFEADGAIVAFPTPPELKGA